MEISDIVTALSFQTNTINQLLEVERANYLLGLFFLGCVGAVFVCLLLYKFIKLFY